MRYRFFLMLLMLLIISNACLSPEPKKDSSNIDKDGNIKEIADKVARFAPFTVKYDPKALGLDERAQKMVEKIVEASNYLESIYWRQNSNEGVLLLRKLESVPAQEPILHYLRINAGPFDLIDENKPFVLNIKRYEGAGLYPPDLTKAEFEKYLAAHPESRAQLESPYTVVKRKGSELIAVPYREEYKTFLEPASKLLKEASTFADDASLKKFLLSRADALLTDDYFASDLDWLDVRDSNVDIIFGPYETYVDTLAGIKTSYGAGVLIRDREESEKLKTYQKYFGELEANLPLNKRFRTNKADKATPMMVNYNLFRSGDLAHGYQAVADNLPNDARVQQQKGSKKFFFKNFMTARVDKVILPLAKELMVPEQVPLVTGEGYFSGTLMHEICHGLGPNFVKKDSGEEITINRALGDLYSAIEEAKADICGLHSLIYLTEKKVIPEKVLQEQLASYLGGILRTVRFGTAEAHGQAEITEYNFLVKEGGISFDAPSGKYRVNFDRMPDAIKRLAEELLMIEATGDRARAEQLFADYGKMPDYMKKSFEKVRDIPVDLDPRFAFSIKIY